jgi:RNase adaptor protein for sRNA GlmZ degradation
MKDLARAIAEQAELAAKSFYRLVVVAGPAGSGKTRALKQLQTAKGWSLLNLNRALSERLLDLTSKQRRLRTADIVRGLIEAQGNQTVTM